jgi:hypothetical protein
MWILSNGIESVIPGAVAFLPASSQAVHQTLVPFAVGTIRFSFALYKPQARTLTVKLVTRTKNKGHAIAHGLVFQIGFDFSNPRAQSGMV